ncbi:hypothetical protein MTO96_036428 [Rhipicephalus appendiculatus]
MAELSQAVGRFATNFLRGRSARRSRGGTDQRSPGRDIGGVRGNPVAPMNFWRRRPLPQFAPVNSIPRPLSAPPPYQESDVYVNSEPPFSEDDVERAARHLGHIRRSNPEHFPELERIQFEDIDEQTSRPTNTPGSWDWCPMKWKHKRLYFGQCLFGFIATAIVYPLLARVYPGWCPYYT